MFSTLSMTVLDDGWIKVEDLEAVRHVDTGYRLERPGSRRGGGDYRVVLGFRGLYLVRMTLETDGVGEIVVAGKNLFFL